MKQTAQAAVVRMNELQQRIDLLVGMRPSPHPVISVYLDLGQETGQLARFVRRRITACTNSIPAAQRARLRACGESVIEQLFHEQAPHARGLAIFAAADGAAPLLTAMPFAAPFRNGLTVSSSPDIFPLLQLREMYGRFTIVAAQPEGLQVAEVNLGEIAIRAWVATPQSQSLMPESDDTPATPAGVDIQPQIRLIERVLNKTRSDPLFLAGDVETMQRIRDLLAPNSIGRLVGAVPVPADEPLQNIAARCLRSLMEFEANQASELTARILEEARHHGPAVTGPEASLRALRTGAAERLLLGRDYRPEPGWTCGLCSEESTPRFRLQRAPGGVAETSEAVNLRVELVRLAGQRRVPVEFTGDDTLNDYGGVACLLHDHPEQTAQHLPPRYGSLDLVA